MKNLILSKLQTFSKACFKESVAVHLVKSKWIETRGAKNLHDLKSKSNKESIWKSLSMFAQIRHPMEFFELF
jgi:hypothetical protein